MSYSNQQLLRARKFIASGKYAQAERIYKDLTKPPKNDLLASAEYATFLEKLARWQDLKALWQHACKHPQVSLKMLSQLANLHLRLNELTEAAEVVDRIESKSGLDAKLLALRYSIASAAGKHQEALRIALEAVKFEPKSVVGFVNLGVAFCDLAMREQGEAAFKIALELEPDNITALINLGFIHSEKQETEESIRFYERALELTKIYKGIQKEVIEFPLSFNYLSSGRLSEGWRLYDSGFHVALKASSRRTPSRIFDVPTWLGQALGQETLLIWREQGLGDELRFSSCLEDVSKRCAKIIVECDPRLIKIFQRSFPRIRFREPKWNVSTGKADTKDYDFHIPMGSLPRYFRNKINDFYPLKSYLIPSEKDCAEIKKVFDQNLPKGKKIGICWRSGNLNPTRNDFYNNLVDWADILRTPGCVFINLQYGNAEGEIQSAEKALGVKIYRWDDLDLKNDLEGVFALISNLELVISVGTAVAAMAPLVGTPTWQLLPKKHWTEFNSEEWLWSDKMTIFRGDGTTGLEIPMKLAKRDLMEWVK